MRYDLSMKFQLVADQVRQDILAGRWPVGSRLPTEQELLRTHQVSLNTVRRALDVLVKEGLVERRQGSGTFVRAVPPNGARRPRFVGVVVPTTGHIYAGVIEGIESVAATAGVRVVLASSEYNLGQEAARMRELLDMGVDGLLLVPNLHRVDQPNDYVNQLRALPVPYVLVERRLPNPPPDDPTRYVCTNHVGGVHLAVRHLVELGHERLGYLGQLHSSTADTVVTGFERAITHFSLPRVASAIQREDSWPTDQLAAYAQTCIAEGVTAVFSLSDRDATRLLPLARQAGLSVPDRLSVIAYNDDVAELAEVPLTTISRPAAEIGRLAADSLLRQIQQGPDAPIQQIHIQPRLLVRESCAPVPAKALLG
ncbi:GntR family transcriptional regulator [Jiangella asiatica]|uniref:GntR family transcriptional regulator n=2 Tax=Jiangella asiatica TaxID=2530372 RepID=A0A4V2Z2M2_9ACTN|nr:GntR family transcriptional regulator [Jiangella asiatica]